MRKQKRLFNDMPITTLTIVCSLMVLIYSFFVHCHKIKTEIIKPDMTTNYKVTHELLQIPVTCSNNKMSFFDTCVCKPGFNGHDCQNKIVKILDCDCPATEVRCRQLCKSSGDMGIFQSDNEQTWKQANDQEYGIWKSVDGVEFHDRSPEHAEGFSNYAFFDMRTLGKVLEVGCGPYTQSKWLMQTCKNCTLNDITLVDPNVFRYLKLESCAYKSGNLNNLKTILISGLVEDLKFDSIYDTIVSINVLDHVNDALQYLENIYKALRKGGLLVFHDRFWENADVGQQVLGSYELHPIRLKKKVYEIFFAKFQSVEYINTQPTRDMIARNGQESGYYIILRK